MVLYCKHCVKVWAENTTFSVKTTLTRHADDRKPTSRKQDNKAFDCLMFDLLDMSDFFNQI